jgi:hypothetical protein
MNPDLIVLCPACESGELRPGPLLVRCSDCGYAVSRDLYLDLRRLRALPEAEPAGRCARPGTRCLPGGAPESPPYAGEGAQREAPKKS